MVKKKSKINDTFFENIPKNAKEEKRLLSYRIIKKMSARASFKESRELLMVEKKNLISKIYNLSLQINKLDEESTILLQKYNGVKE